MNEQHLRTSACPEVLQTFCQDLNSPWLKTPSIFKDWFIYALRCRPRFSIWFTLLVYNAIQGYNSRLFRFSFCCRRFALLFSLISAFSFSFSCLALRSICSYKAQIHVKVRWKLFFYVNELHTLYFWSSSRTCVESITEADQARSQLISSHSINALAKKFEMISNKNNSRNLSKSKFIFIFLQLSTTANVSTDAPEDFFHSLK